MYFSISILVIDSVKQGLFSLPEMPFFHDLIVMTFCYVKPCYVMNQPISK